MPQSGASFALDQPGNEKPSKERNSCFACLLCRKKKVKCDNGAPKCSNCRLYDSECVYGEDKRRRSFTSKSLKALNNKVAAIEAQLAQRESALAAQAKSGSLESLHFPTPGLKAGDQDFCVQGDFSQDLLDQEPNLSAALTSFENYNALFDFSDFNPLGESPVAEPDLSTSVHAPVEDSARPPSITQHRHMEHSHQKSAQQTQQTNPGHWSSLDMRDQDLYQISRRFGRMRLTEGGHLRFFGATSYLSMLPNEVTALYAPPIRNLREEGEAVVASVNLRWPEDVEYEQHLENLYFAWHGPLLNLAPKDVYLREKEVYKTCRDTSLFSPALQNVILAVGALYSERPHPVIHGRASEFFGSRARMIFEMEMDNPTIATTQAAVILSSLEAANGHSSRGWIYSGIAVQMAADLGLHMPIASDEDSLDHASDADVLNQERHGLFWSVYASNIYNSINSGRPSSVRSMRCKAPVVKPLSNGEWKPFVDNGTLMAMPPGIDMRGIDLVCPSVVQLALKFERIYDSLYSEGPENPESSELFLLGMAKELDTWIANVAEPLRWTSSNLETIVPPIVLQLYMLYYEMRILLFRPFLSSDRDSQLSAGDACTHSAEEICRIIQLYRRNYTLRYINVTAVAVVIAAAEIHVHDCCTYSGQKGKTAENNLVTCLQALGEMGQSFNSSIRGLDVITSLRRLWQDQKFRDTKSKRPRDPFSQDERQLFDHHRKTASSFKAW